MSKMFSDLYEKDTEKKAQKDKPKESVEEKARKPGNQEIVKAEVGEEKKEEVHRPDIVDSPTIPPSEDRPTYKSSHLFTEEEFEMFEDIKLSLRRRHGIQAYKNDIARAAIRFLSKDFKENGVKSYLVDHFYRREK